MKGSRDLLNHIFNRAGAIKDAPRLLFHASKIIGLGVASESNPVYSNIVNVRLSEAELVMDFGFFVAQPEHAGKTTIPFDTSVRVVMPAQAAQRFAKLILQASDAHERAKQAASASPTAPKTASQA